MDPVEYADMQSLNKDETIQTAYLVPRSVAEQTGTYRFYSVSLPHLYYKWNYVKGEADDEDGVAANGMPNYLNGWQTSNGHEVEVGQQLSQTFINTYFNGGTNLDLFAIWGQLHLIRVIIYIPQNNLNQDVKYKVIITPTSSYTAGNFPLTENYKSISDTANNIYFTDGVSRITEFGTEDASPLNGVVRYFGVKDGDSVTITTFPMSHYNNDYIPLYNTGQNTVSYKCFCADYLVRTDESNNPNNIGWPAQEVTCYPQTNTNWFVTTLQNITTDKTILIPLVHKPVVSVTISPYNGGTVTGTGNYMPGSSCTLTATPAFGYEFSAWRQSGFDISTNASYNFNVYGDTTYTAVFTYNGGTFVFSWMNTNPLDDLSPYVRINFSVQFQDVPGTPKSYSVSTSSVAIVRMMHSALSKYVYDNTYVYYGDTRNPLSDTALSGSSGTLTYGVTYTVTTTASYTDITFNFSGMAPGTTTKLYANYN